MTPWLRTLHACSLLISLACLLAAFPAISTDASTSAAPLVIWLSLDGVRHDQPDLQHFPAFERIAREGVRASGLEPVFPTSTFTNHVAMATCAHADRHGIVANRFRDRERGLFDYDDDGSWIEVEPIWASAERQGVRSAVFFWVGSATPWRGIAASDRRTPFDRGVGESAKVDQILAWIDRPARERPGLIMTWWRGTDREGHTGGPDSAAIAARLAQQDAQLGRLLRGIDARNLWSRTTLLVSSDHGMTLASRAIDAARTLGRAGIEAEVISGGAVAFVWLADASQRARAKTLLGRLPGHAVHDAQALPERLRISYPQRIGDLLLVAEPPFYYPRSGWLAALRTAWLAWRGGARGGHGYLPEHPDMAGILFAMGRGVASDLQLDRVSNLDLAPTVSRLLGIEPPAGCEGRGIEAIAVGVMGGG